MKLDFWENTGAYTLQVPRGEHNIKDLIEQHGLDFSQPRSTTQEAMLMTREPYAAVSFRKFATPRAMTKLAPMIGQLDASAALTSNAHIRVPADKELWSFQKASVAYALNQNYTLVADQPGLGKTPIAIAYANEIRAKRILCIVPANIRAQWERRIREWTTLPWPYSIYPIYHGRHGVHPTANWTIVSYDLARTPSIGSALAKGSYDLLILDEGHYLKTIGSKRTQAVFGGGLHPDFAPLASRAGAVMVLTGTPLPNRPREAYTLARNLCWDSIDFVSEDDFQERFNPSMQVEGERWNAETGVFEKFIYVDERSGRHMELQNRMRVNFMVRHLKREVMPQLKMPELDIIQLTETAAIKQALKAEKLLDIDPETLQGKDKQTLGLWAIIRHEIGVAAAPQIADYIEMLIDGGEEKLVLAGWHIDVLDIWEKQLGKYGLVRIDGSVTGKNKDKKVRQFVEDPKIKLCIGNIQSMGIGTDGLQEVCNHVLVGEPSPVPGENEQMVDRLDRGGQNMTVQADFFVVPNSIMEKALASSLRKLKVTHQALDKKL